MNDSGRSEATYQAGDRVEVDISAGILPGQHAEPNWQLGIVRGRGEDGLYRVELVRSIAGRPAEKDAAPEHIRRAGSA